MAADGSVTLDMSIDEKGLDKAIAKLNEVIKKFSKDSVEDLSEIDQKLLKLGESAKELKIVPTTEGIQKAEKELDDLNAVIRNQERLLSAYRDEYDRVVKKHGDGSIQAVRLEKNMLALESSIEKNIKQSDEFAKTLGDIEDAMAEGAREADFFAKKVESAGTSTANASNGTSVFKETLGDLVVEGISHTVDALGELIEKTQEYRKDMSLLNTNAEAAGVSLAVTSEAMRELNAITGETDSNVEAVSNLLATGFKDNDLLEAVNALSGAVIKFPDTMKIESLADSLQETIASGEATGQFSELLSRLGVNVEKYNQSIANMSEQHRASYSIALLNREGLSELNEQYRESNSALIDAANAEFDYNEALADLAEVLEPIKTQLMTSFTAVLVENKDVIVGVIEALGSFVDILIKVLDFLMQVPAPVYVIIAAAAVVIGLITQFGSVSGVATALFAKGVAAGAKALASAAPAAAAAGASFGLLALEIMGIVLAIALLVAAIAALVSAFKGVPKSIDFDVSDIPSPDDLKKQAKTKGYATGTSSASSGWAWVGEHGPELVNFRGGEEVLTASQSMARRGQHSSGNVFNYTTNNTFKVDDIQTYQQIEQRMKNERITRRMGYVGVK